MSPPRLATAHAESLSSKKGRAKPTRSLAAEAARFHRPPEGLSPDSLVAGRYRVAMFLKGGMSDIHLAIDIAKGMQVVLKTAKLTGAAPEISVQAIRREGDALSRIRHRNVVGLWERRRSQKNEFLVIEYIKGGDLHWLLDKKGQLPWPTVKNIALQLCDALQASHDNDVVHGDIKPENIIISNDNRVVLLDFGAAKLMDSPSSAEEGAEFVLGTLDYTAPEIFSSLSSDHRADIYGLGVLMYEMLTGWNPFYADDNEEIVRRVVQHMPEPPSSWAYIPQCVDDLVMRSMAKDPEDRFGSIHEVRGAIESCK